MFDSWISVTQNKHAHLTADELKSVYRLALFYPAQALAQSSSPIQKFTYQPSIHMRHCGIFSEGTFMLHKHRVHDIQE